MAPVSTAEFVKGLAASDSRGTLFWATLGCASLLVWYLGASKKKKSSSSSAAGGGGGGSNPTEFDGFLKRRPERKASCATDFGSFLKGSSQAAQVATEAVEEEEEEGVVAPPGDAVRVPVLFGTEYGFSKEIAEKMCAELKTRGKFWPVLLNMADFPKGWEIKDEKVLLVVCSTQGDGVPPPEAREFCDWLFEGGAGELPDLKFSVCALGDSSYPHFCRCGNTIHQSFMSAGAHSFVERQEVDKEDWKAIDRWMSTVIESLPLLSLPTIDDMGGDFLDLSGTVEKVAKWGKNTPYSAEITNIQGLCDIKSGKDKNTILVELNLGDSGLEYIPGDALGIYPTNCPQAVDELLKEMGANEGHYQVDTPSWFVDRGLTDLDDISGHQNPPEIPLREALSELFDIKTPKAEIFGLLLEAHTQPLVAVNGVVGPVSSPTLMKGTDKLKHSSSQVEKLKLLMNDTKLREQYLEERHLIDILKEFNHGKKRISFQQIVSCLRALQPRLYSISSSPLEDSRSVSITVAEVVYSSLGIERKGVASTCVSQRLQVHSSLPVYVSKNPDFRLPHLSVPIIMVGPGTGLAPFRAFIWERILAKEKHGGEIGQQVLFFGCRKRDQDYLYGDLLEQWAKEGVISLFTAFSRERKEKVYVQHKLKEASTLVWDLLCKGAHFYVCGDASSMAGDVEKVLLEIIDSNRPQGVDPNGYAKDYLDNLSVEGRYQRDVWF